MMRAGMIGLGRMGGNMARRLGRRGMSVHGFSRGAGSLAGLANEDNVTVASRLEDMLAALAPPRVVWMMVPAGTATDENVEALAARLAPGDIVVDGGNAHYRDSQRRGRLLAGEGIGFVDAGVSGGVWGLEQGYGLMLGGVREQVDAILPLVRALAPAPDRGWVHCGASGAGHFAKMVHNGIEYGLMQAYAEGFALLAAKRDLGLPVGEIARAWCHGTVIRSWLLELAADVLKDEAAPGAVAARVADSGEGRWTAQEAIDLGVPVPVISAALMARFSSQGGGDFGARLLARLRNAFGGHALPRQ
jgi:6-phosphogluconate dehydrogenase